MNTRRITALLCILSVTTAFVAAQEPQQKDSKRGRLFRDSVAVFHAFQSFEDNATAAASAMAAPNVQGPVLEAAAIYPAEFRTTDGSGNNPTNLGRAGTNVLRRTNGYGDGVSTMAGADQRGARDISNLVNAQSQVFPNSANVTSFIWGWGQFTDHDISIEKNANPAELMNIPVPRGDPVFDPRGGGRKTLPDQRSSWSLVNGVRTQIDAVTSFLDASQVYGSEANRLTVMRTNDGTGHLATSDGNLLPFNTQGLPNQPQSQPGKVIIPGDFFLGGDVRANENASIFSLQTLFMREHNFWADTIKAANPSFNDDAIFQRARAIVNAETQLITYRDFLPALLGPNALPPYTGYNSAVDPRVAIEFASAGFRVGHTFLPPVLMRLDASGRSQPGDIALGSTFFEPQLFVSNGIETYLRGLAKQVPQQVDAYVIDAVRNFTFLRTQGFDLPALNIQRGRDHGLGRYNQVRVAYGLPAKNTFAEMTSNLDFQTRLASAYNSPNDVDPWVGGLCEDHVNGGLVGETFFAIIRDQFLRLRDGDRFWYESYLDPATLATVQQQSLATIIRRNTPITTEIQDDVFHTP